LNLDLAQTLGLGFVTASWFAFAAIFLLQKKPPKARTEKRAPASRWGIALQGLAFGAVWGTHRWSGLRLLSLPAALQDLLSLVAIPLAIVSASLTLSAVRTLGKQWSFEARLAEGHRLIVAGPYSHMRHPIYTAMLGMLIATGLAVSFWPAVVAAVIVFSIGTAIRVHAEEKLLRGAFGEDFEAYARHVPAILPRLGAAGPRPS
jgi:protein-S-isoprenylcysteine O-methyltransferase Ste14